MKLDKILMNPIRMRIVQYMMVNDTATATELTGELPDVPRTTLYRHIGVLEKNNILSVVQENKIRGTIEKVYTLSMEANADEEPVQAAKNNAFSYMMSIYSDFARYLSGESINTQEDRLFIKDATLYLSDQEFDDFFEEMENVFKKYSEYPENEKRRCRRISTISSPQE